MVAPLPIWKPLPRRLNGKRFQRSPEMLRRFRSLAMTFSYTQISQFLRCPRAYRYKYLDGWREKDSRATAVFGRCFEKALAALLSDEDSGAMLFKEWGNYAEAEIGRA